MLPPLQRMRQAFVRDAGYLIGGSLAQHALLLALQILLARNLPVEEFGQLAFFGSALSLLAIFGTAGLTYYLPALARRRSAEGQAPPWGLAGWAAAFAGLFAIANAVAYAAGLYQGFRSELGSLYYWLSATLPLLCLTHAIQAVLVGYGRTRLLFHLNLATEAARLLVPVALLWIDALDARSLVLGWFAVQAFALASHLAIAFAWRRRFPRGGSGDLAWGRDHWESLAYMVPASATLLLPKLLVFLTGVTRSEEETAAMGVAMLFMSAFGVLLIPYQTALLSHLQGLGDGAGRRAFLRTSARDLAAIILSMGAVAWLAGWFLTVPLFGADLDPARRYLGFLVLLFALDAPRAILDPLVAALPALRSLFLVESARLAAVVALFTALPAWIPGLAIHPVLAGAAALGLLANAFKFLKVASAGRPWNWSRADQM